LCTGEQDLRASLPALQADDHRRNGLPPDGSRATESAVLGSGHPLNTSVIEGIDNTIKVIKRRAYGYRDEEYIFLKIRAAFPGNPR
ncbi:transposase, partial [Burkholderia sp. AW49-1]